MKCGIPKERIINIGKMIDNMSMRQYFDLPDMPHVDDEVFVDAGGFDGMTSKILYNGVVIVIKNLYL